MPSELLVLALLVLVPAAIAAAVVLIQSGQQRLIFSGFFAGFASLVAYHLRAGTP